MCVQVQVEDSGRSRSQTVRELQKDYKIFQPQLTLNRTNCIETQTANNSAETRRNQIHAETIDV